MNEIVKHRNELNDFELGKLSPNQANLFTYLVYKIKDKFYQIHWVNNSILVEEMKVPYIDDIKILDGNENNKK